MSITFGPLSSQLWQGLSTDTKPTATDVRLQMNAVFFEKDTFRYYLWDGVTWNSTAAGSGAFTGANTTVPGATPPPMI